MRLMKNSPLCLASFCVVGDILVGSPTVGHPATATAQPASPTATPNPTPPPARQKPNHLFKGYEIYSWQTPPNHWHYALHPGTNRLKTAQEILAGSVSQKELESQLAQLPELEDVSWCPSIELTTGPALKMPPKAVQDSVRDLAKRRNIHLSLCEPDPKTTPTVSAVSTNPSLQRTNPR